MQIGRMIWMTDTLPLEMSLLWLEGQSVGLAKKQPTVALSTSEAEYMALGSARSYMAAAFT